jgi:hypothetical protein
LAVAAIVDESSALSESLQNRPWGLGFGAPAAAVKINVATGFGRMTVDE